MGSGGCSVGSREDHKGVLVSGSGKRAEAKACAAAGDLALGRQFVNAWGRVGQRWKTCVLKVVSVLVHLWPALTLCSGMRGTWDQSCCLPGSRGEW